MMMMLLVRSCVDAASLWPQPVHETYDTSSPPLVLESTFKFVDGSEQKGTPFLTAAFERYTALLAPSRRGALAADVSSTLGALTVVVDDTSAELIFGVNESQLKGSGVEALVNITRF